jgi:pseudaminic acid synthase
MVKNALSIKIGPSFKPFIIAEISANHKKSIRRVFKLIDKAKIAGVSAIKLQSYKANTLTLNIKNKNFFIKNKKNLWHSNYMYDIYQKGSTPWSWTKQIFNYAKKKKLICFSSPFDTTAVDMLEKVNCPIYKIASFELTDFILLKKVAQTKKPIILSTGMASFKEIKESIKFLKKHGNKKLYLLKCTSTYPAQSKDLNLITIKDMQKKFNSVIGYSDHSLGISAAVTAISLGANLIEKHFTLNKNDGALDSKFSADPQELNELVKACNEAWVSLGTVKYGPTKSEKNSIKKRRSLFFIKNLEKGKKISYEDFGSFRPALGLETKYFKKIIGKKLTKKVKYGDPVKKNVLNYNK